MRLCVIAEGEEEVAHQRQARFTADFCLLRDIGLKALVQLCVGSVNIPRVGVEIIGPLYLAVSLNIRRECGEFKPADKHPVFAPPVKRVE